jgi:hypothetical protein
MELEGSLPSLQECTNGPYSEKDNLSVNIQDQVIFRRLALGMLTFLCKLHSQVENFVFFLCGSTAS